MPGPRRTGNYAALRRFSVLVLVAGDGKLFKLHADGMPHWRRVGAGTAAVPAPWLSSGERAF